MNSIGETIAGVGTEPKLPAGYTCEDVPRVVAEIGKVRTFALAFENGATFKQVNEARRCLLAK